MDKTIELELRIKKVETILEQILEVFKVLSPYFFKLCEEYDIYKDIETNKFFYYSACDSHLTSTCNKSDCWSYSDCYKKALICNILNDEI